MESQSVVTYLHRLHPPSQTSIHTNIHRHLQRQVFVFPPVCANFCYHHVGIDMRNQSPNIRGFNSSLCAINL